MIQLQYAIASIIQESWDQLEKSKTDMKVGWQEDVEVPNNIKEVDIQQSPQQQRQQPHQQVQQIKVEVYAEEIEMIREMIEKFGHLLSMFEADEGDLDGYLISALLSSGKSL
ncbi:unnamed protein product [Protopolystoma xenopodis]|uniref:Uncharacterized protein n=1 Tax=Protopolystoma xenopodis TaxID=117903 RepID=A0A3S5AMP3_9PLAT|nr:unnamed protein product [Protopolystoma xenopodis]